MKFFTSMDHLKVNATIQFTLHSVTILLLTYPEATCKSTPTPWSTVLPEKLAGPQLVNSPRFMEPEGSLPHSQAPTNCPYPEPDESSPYLPIPLLEDPF
jgi:hypothetical protein